MLEAVICWYMLVCLIASVSEQSMLMRVLRQAQGPRKRMGRLIAILFDSFERSSAFCNSALHQYTSWKHTFNYPAVTSTTQDSSIIERCLPPVQLASTFQRPGDAKTVRRLGPFPHFLQCEPQIGRRFLISMNDVFDGTMTLLHVRKVC